MSVNRMYLLLGALVVCGGAVADEAAPGAKPGSGCGEAAGYESLRRSAHFKIARTADGFDYKCSLRKKRQRKKDTAGFRRDCVAFVNKFIDILNRCEDAGIPRLARDQLKVQGEKQESDKSLEYTGFIPISS